MASNNGGLRVPDFILKAAARPEDGGRPEKYVRVGAAWAKEENKTISITLDNFVVLQGQPHSNISLLLVPNEKSEYMREKGMVE